MKLLCDTNAITALRLGNQEVLKLFENATTILLSVVVLGELLSGFKHGSRLDENLKFLDAFKGKSFVDTVPINYETAEIYSDIYSYLRKTGKPIPSNDLWIAAQCVEQGAVLLSADRHFSAIPTLRVQSWVQ